VRSGKVREIGSSNFSAEQIREADGAVRDGAARFNELRTSYRRVRRFLPALLQTVTFGASPAGQPLIEAIGYLKAFDADKKKTATAPPLDIVDGAWRGHVICDGKVDPQAYTFCFLDRLRKGLRRRDVFVAPSVRYADPRVGLLATFQPRGWSGACGRCYRPPPPRVSAFLPSFPFCREFSLCDSSETLANRAGAFFTINEMAHFVECQDRGSRSFLTFSQCREQAR
jgi:hypothetical protein